MEEDLIKYIKEHVESDLEANRSLCGSDLSLFISDVLHLYNSTLRQSPSLFASETMDRLGILGLGRLRSEVGSVFDRDVSFHETVKIGPAMLELYRQRQRMGLDEINIYISELGARELSPEDLEFNGKLLELYNGCVKC